MGRHKACFWCFAPMHLLAPNHCSDYCYVSELLSKDETDKAADEAGRLGLDWREVFRQFRHGQFFCRTCNHVPVKRREAMCDDCGKLMGWSVIGTARSST